MGITIMLGKHRELSEGLTGEGASYRCKKCWSQSYGHLGKKEYQV